MYDYTGKTIFVGLDVHKKTYSLTAISDGVIVKRETLKADPGFLVSYLKKRFGTGAIKTAYEAGFSGFHLHRALVAAGIKNIVVHAASIEISHDRVKTDKRDSLKIAVHLSHGKLKGIHVPTPEREDYRNITRLRDTFSKARVRIACQIKSLLFQHGLIAFNETKKTSERWIKKLLTLALEPGLKFSIEEQAKMWLTYNEKIKEINCKLKEQACEDKKIDDVYQSAPGIGPTSARILANELGDMQQFENERKIFSYLGFTPSEYSSGEHVRQGHITKQGKPILRKILVQAAWTAIRYDMELCSIFNDIASRAGSKRAIIAIARRLIGRLRACFRDQKMYEKREVKITEIISSQHPPRNIKSVEKIA
jgi:transposase